MAPKWGPLSELNWAGLVYRRVETHGMAIPLAQEVWAGSLAVQVGSNARSVKCRVMQRNMEF